MPGKPKPTRLKLLTGNPGKRNLPKEPDVSSGLPDPPSHLDAYALEEWHRLAAGLHALGLFFDVDRGAFSAYCQAYSRWRHAEEELNALAKANPLSALILKTVSGNFIQQPLIGIANKAMGDMVRYSTEFGLTPSARARLAVDPNRGRESKFKNLIGGKKHE